jgi:transposase
VLYLGEINDSQREAWLKSIEAFEETRQEQRQLALFPSDRAIPEHAREFGVQVKLSQFRLERPRQWGACWTFVRLWEQLRLDEFWRERLADSREGTSWYHVLMVLVAYRLIDPGSEWRLHRDWYARSAMGDLLDEDESLASKDTLYRCHEKLLEHKEALFGFLKQRWQDLFGVKFDVLLYDLTSTYFESDPPFPEDDKRRYGYSRDHRSDCVQVVIALIVTPEGFPLTYEVLAGNTADSTMLPAFLERVEQRYGQAQRVWVMDRGIPTEAHLQKMPERGASYLVGTPKGRLSKLERELATKPWQEARPEVKVKLLPQDEELYVFVQSEARIGKERSMRRKKLKWLWGRLKDLQRQQPIYETLLMKIGAAQKQVGRLSSLVRLSLPDAPPKTAISRRVTFQFALDRERLRIVRRREGRYLLRSNLTASDPAQLWQFYLQLVEVEAAFKNLKDELAIRPVFHQREDRIEAHIFVASLAYCVHVTFRHQLKAHAPGLTVRQALEKLERMQLLDVRFPTTDGRELLFSRYTEPEAHQQLLLAKLGWALPAQAPPKIAPPKIPAAIPLALRPWKTKRLCSSDGPSCEGQARLAREHPATAARRSMASRWPLTREYTSGRRERGRP